ncbi:MAG: hypothetical protein AB4290_05720 [Spirulina sp.]
MDNNKIFRLIWRFNAIVIMGAGLLAIAVLGFAVISILLDVTRPQQRSNIVNIDRESEIEENLRFGEFREISGTPYLTLSLNSHQSYDRGFSSFDKETKSTRNILFFHSETEEKHWLLDRNDSLIVSDRLLREPTPANEPSRVLAIMYSVVKEDTDGNKRLSPRDLQTIAFSQPNGLEYRELLTDIERILGYKLVDRDTLVIVYQQAGSAYSAKISLNNFTLTNPTKLPIPQEN